MKQVTKNEICQFITTYNGERINDDVKIALFNAVTPRLLQQINQQLSKGKPEELFDLVLLIVTDMFGYYFHEHPGALQKPADLNFFVTNKIIGAT
jgi:hypothetical protein